MSACTYCGCDVTVHDPVFVERIEAGDRVPAGQFCNYGCLAVHIDEAGLAEGTTCRLD